MVWLFLSVKSEESGMCLKDVLHLKHDLLSCTRALADSRDRNAASGSGNTEGTIRWRTRAFGLLLSHHQM